MSGEGLDQPYGHCTLPLTQRSGSYTEKHRPKTLSTHAFPHSMIEGCDSTSIHPYPFLSFIFPPSDLTILDFWQTLSPSAFSLSFSVFVERLFWQCSKGMPVVDSNWVGRVGRAVLLHSVCRQNKERDLKKESVGDREGAADKARGLRIPHTHKRGPGPPIGADRATLHTHGWKGGSWWAWESAVDKIPGPTNHSL